jgi:hypothetical protein
MQRIFKKKHDLSARNAEARARRRRRQRLGVESLEGRQLLSLLPGESVVNGGSGSFRQQFESANASTADGRSVVVWTETFNDTNPSKIDHDIFAQLYDAGGNKVGGQISVDTDAFDARHPSVAMDPAGNFVVAYEKSNATDTLQNPLRGIVAQRFHVDSTAGRVTRVGNLMAIDTAVRSSFGPDHDLFFSNPDVAMDGNADFVITATKSVGNINNVAATQSAVQWQLFDRNGNFRKSALIGSFENGNTTDGRARVVMSVLNGQFDIVYEEDTLGVASTSHVARFDPNGLTNGGGGTLSDGRSSQVINPDIAMDNAGNTVMVYQKLVGNDFDIYAQRMDKNGVLGSEFVVKGTGAEELVPSVALFRNGGPLVVAYNTDLFPGHTNRTVEVTEVSGTNAVLGTGNLGASPNNADPAVTIDGNGFYQLNFTAGVGSSNQDIHNVFGTLNDAPAAKNLALTPTIQAGQSAVLTGQLTDADGDTNLRLTVDWGDHSKPQQSKPGTNPFAVAHTYTHAGTYTVHVTWSNSTGRLSNSRDLTVVVTKKDK